MLVKGPMCVGEKSSTTTSNGTLPPAYYITIS
jgi:hypothetical protein